MINYSIIIPHKNIPELLRRCLDSIPRREDVQIIVVDDNSDTGKVDFNNFPGLNDPYVEVVFGKNENGRKGAGYARNLGLERAKGKWLIFADADDFFNDCIGEELDRYVGTDFDIIFFTTNSVNSETLQKAERGLLWNQFCVAALTDGDYTMLKYHRYPPWAKFVSRKLIEDNKIRFQETIVANDVLFSILTGHFAEKIAVSLVPIYSLTERAGSLEMTTSFDRYKSYFISVCSAFDMLRPYKIEHYLDDMIFYWWIEMKKKNIIFSFLYYLKLLSYCGLDYVLKRHKRAIKMKIKSLK